MQYTYTNKDKVQSKSLGWVSRINTSAAPNQGIFIKNRGNNALLQQAGSMPMKFEAADNDASFAMGRKDFVKTVNATSGMTMNNADQSSYLARRKALATGKIIQSAPISFRSQDKNVVNSALRRTRNSGYIVPKKVSMRNIIQPTYYSSAQVLANANNKWISYQGYVYNLSNFNHTNTNQSIEDTLEEAYGKDLSTVLSSMPNNHQTSGYLLPLLEGYKIGILSS